MINPFKEINWNPDVPERRKFARSLVLGFPCVALVLLLFIRIRTGAWSAGVPLHLAGWGALAGAIFWIVPAIAKPFYVVWYALACAIGLVLGNVLISLIYYTLVSGTGLLKRLGGKQPIVKTPDRAARSYWLDAAPTPPPERYYHQF